MLVMVLNSVVMQSFDHCVHLEQLITIDCCLNRYIVVCRHRRIQLGRKDEKKQQLWLLQRSLFVDWILVVVEENNSRIIYATTFDSKSNHSGHFLVLNIRISVIVLSQIGDRRRVGLFGCWLEWSRKGTRVLAVQSMSCLFLKMVLTTRLEEDSTKILSVEWRAC
jgi:hypothetical protein